MTHDLEIGGEFDVVEYSNGLVVPSKPKKPRAHARDNRQPQSPSPRVTTDYSEAALADKFVEEHGDYLRHVAVWSKWLHYDGQRWKTERTHLVRDLATKLCKDAADECDAREIASSKTIAGVQTLAAADRQIAATVDQWDADLWLLNTPGGVVDLTTGEMLPHDPDDHMSKTTAAEPGGDCPLWLAFLDRTFAGNTDLIGYAQRMFGYGLTGSTREHAMFFGHGSGGNGKSVLIDTAAGILGDYHTTAPIETFTAAAGDRHSTELAMPQGARLVTTVETEQGRRWAEARIKTLTGGDRISAPFMRQGFFEFKPQFKLLIVGNHKPVLRVVDEAIRRRFNLIPFTVTIPDHEKDLTLTERLKAEWPGILQWMIDGCIAWQKTGLCPPATVSEATADYLDAEDTVSAWIDECCG